MKTKNIFKDLNKQQKQAVLTIKGPLLIIAGAGSGKTKVITHRIAYLVSQRIKPEQILGLTFTNKAADEMRLRIHKLISIDKNYKKRPWIGTFHALGAQILRLKGELIGIPKNFTILDEEDSIKIVKEAAQKLDINPKQFQPSKIFNFISQKKAELINCPVFKKNADEFFYTKVIAEAWEEYEKLLKQNYYLDFDDLILKPVELFKEYPIVLKKFQNKWQYILIDEYQDTNHSQYVMSNMLAMSHRNICAVGDVDQSIYGWRGADFRNILHFEKDYPETKIITLEENYRSTKNILAAANLIIAKNKLRKPKNLFTQNPGGCNLKLYIASDEKEEARLVIQEILNLINKEGVKPKSIAILFRINSQSRIFEEELIKNNIPYQFIGVKFYQRKEIKDVLCFLKAALNPADFLSIQRMLKIRPIKKGDLKNLLADFKQFINHLPASKAIHLIIQKSGYEEYLNDGSEEGFARLANIKELLSISQKYDNLKPSQGVQNLIEDAALISEQDNIKEGASTVRLMTIHSAKGLEFSAVFVTGLEEGLFPYSAFALENKENHNEEERRLCYVALTRAKEKLFLSYSVFRNSFGGKQLNKPSRFILELNSSFNKLDKYE